MAISDFGDPGCVDIAKGFLVIPVQTRGSDASAGRIIPKGGDATVQRYLPDHSSSVVIFIPSGVTQGVERRGQTTGAVVLIPADQMASARWSSQRDGADAAVVVIPQMQNAALQTLSNRDEPPTLVSEKVERVACHILQ
jgi:hypothetical protein